MLNLTPNRQPRDLSDTVQWLNSSGETVPAYGVVKLFDYDETTNQYQAKKPDGTSGIYYANGGVSIALDKYSGSLLWNLPRRCLVESGDYSVGGIVGPVSGSWSMGSSGEGWRILRPPNADNVAVVEKAAGSSSSGGGGGSSGCCSCECIESGDLYINGELTSSVWEASIGQVSEKQTHGIITVDAAIHRIEWDSDEEYWYGDVDPALLSAKYNDGSDATADTTMSATLIMRVNNGGFTTLTMTITGTVPEP